MRANLRFEPTAPSAQRLKRVLCAFAMRVSLMSELKQLIRNFGFESWMLSLTALAAIFIGLLDFVGWLNLSTDQLLQIVVVGIGLLMGAVIAQTSRRASEINELRKLVGVAEITILESRRSFPQHLVQSISKAQRFVLDTALNFELPPSADDPQKQYKQILDKRVRQSDISFRRVEVIFNRERFEKMLRRLLTYEGFEYFIRYYDAPPKAIPLLNMMSFDDEHFYLGGFYPAEPTTEELVVYIRHPEIAQFFRDYWNILWLRAIPLNEGKRIDWAGLKRLALHLGMTESEYDSMVTKLKDEIQREKGQTS